LKNVLILFWCLVGVCCIAAVLSFANNFIAPLFLNSRIERQHETGLPMASVEKGGIVYCRMKADDFRFPLPPGSSAVLPVIVSGGFDTVDGSVEARFEGSKQVTATEYQNWLASRLQVGAYVTSEPVPGGLLIKFHYFGDR
jgi:hypothetical protein